MFLHYLRPEKCQKSYPETRISATPKFFTTLSQRIAKSNRKRHEFCTKTALIDPSKNAKESIQFSRISHIILKKNALINPIHTNQTTTWEHLVACCLNCRPIVTHSDSSTLVQDAVLNCYKKPAHYYYHFPIFQKTSFILCSILAQICSGC